MVVRGHLRFNFGEASLQIALVDLESLAALDLIAADLQHSPQFLASGDSLRNEVLRLRSG